jgi:hypothetical protein
VQNQRPQCCHKRSTVEFGNELSQRVRLWPLFAIQGQ